MFTMKTLIIILLFLILLLVLRNRTSYFTGPSDTLNEGDHLAMGQQLTSQNGTFKAVMQEDGNFVIYNNTTGRVVWTANSWMGIEAARAAGIGLHLEDGDLSVTNGRTKNQWPSGTLGKGNAPRTVKLQNGGALVLRGADGHVLWSSRPV